MEGLAQLQYIKRSECKKGEKGQINKTGSSRRQEKKETNGWALQTESGSGRASGERDHERAP